jgi:hypothetical protein|tara:strand:- start:1537 stop:1650 length:114 start_codon:yes stop_codon:yes gene_type:complete
MIGKLIEIAIWIMITALTGFGLFGLFAALGEGNQPLE